MVFVSSEKAEDIPPTDLLSWLFEDTPKHPDKPLLIDAKAPEACLSWAQITTLVRQLTAGLRAHGLKHGDCLCIMSATNIYYYPTVYACIATGATFYGAPTRWTPAECAEYAVPLAGVTHFLVDPVFIPHAVAALEASSGDLSRLFVFDRPDSPEVHAHAGKQFPTWSSLLEHGNADWERIRDIETAKNSIAMRLNTGGTSGAPKVAQLSHYAAVAHIFQWCRSFQTHAFDIKALHYLGLNGISGHAFTSTAIKLKFPVYLLPHSLSDIRAACETFSPTLAMIDPHTMLMLVKTSPEGSTALKSLRDVRLPAMDFPAHARQIVQAALHPDCLISRPYGLTEIGTVSATLYKQRDYGDPSSVGFTFPGIEIKLVDDDGSEVTGCDTPGELLVKTPAMFTDYYNNDAGTADAFRDGWFVTGDVAYISSLTQQWYVVGRKKYVFKVTGKYVAPEEIESLMVSHKDVSDAAIAPFYIQRQRDPAINAFVVPKIPGSLTETDIKSLVSASLPLEKAITGRVYFVDGIPRNGLRKVIRWKLHEMTQREIEAHPNALDNHHLTTTPPVDINNGRSVVDPLKSSELMNGNGEVETSNGNSIVEPLKSNGVTNGIGEVVHTVQSNALTNGDGEVVHPAQSNGQTNGNGEVVYPVQSNGLTNGNGEMVHQATKECTKGLFGHLYAFPECPRLLPLLAIAAKNNLNVEVIDTRPANSLAIPASGVPAEYLDINSLGKVPSFRGTDGFVLSECIAIALYLTQLDPHTTLLGSNAQEYASVVQWLSFGNSELMPALGKWLRPLLGADPYYPDSVASARLRALDVTESLTKHLSSDREWLVGQNGGQLTIADVFVASMLARGMQFVLDEEWRTGHSAVMAWFDKVIALEWVGKVMVVKPCKHTITHASDKVY